MTYGQNGQARAGLPALSGQRILMTGVTGQVGAAVARTLARDNQVFGLARYGAPGARQAVEAAGIIPVAGDFVAGAYDSMPDDIDYVLHFAADTNPATLEEGLRTNALGTGRLFHRFAGAKAWLYTSTTGVYWDDPNPYYAYKETDRCGGSTRVTTRFHYGTSKFAGEAAARAMSAACAVPLVIGRLNWSYGESGDGGLPGMVLESLLAARPIQVHEDWPMLGSPVHEDDIAAMMSPFLGAAQVGGYVINLAGDEVISNVELALYLGELTGRAAGFTKVRTAGAYPRVTDNNRRLEVYGRCRVAWRDGMRRMVQARHPELRLADTPS